MATVAPDEKLGQKADLKLPEQERNRTEVDEDGQADDDSDLHESLLYKFYLDHKAQLTHSAQNLKILFKGNEEVYSEVEIDEILKTFKEK